MDFTFKTAKFKFICEHCLQCSTLAYDEFKQVDGHKEELDKSGWGWAGPSYVTVNCSVCKKVNHMQGTVPDLLQSRRLFTVRVVSQ